MSAICLLFLLLFANAPKSSPSPSPSVSPPAPPTVTVSLQRSVIREEDTVPVTVWLSNPSSQAITDVQVDITKPWFVGLSTPQCDGKLLGSTVTFGDVAANSSVNCNLHLITTRDTEIVVGEYNLLFTAGYKWQDNTGVHKSVVTVEKPLKVNLLGTDSVAGIPLALAGFIVPGLFFWIAVRLLRVPWGVDTPLGDKTIYSVTISALFMAVGAWYDYFNVNNGISLNKLFKLAVIGFGLGVVVAIAYHVWEWWRRKRTAADRISFTDSQTTILGKILKLDSHYNPGKLRRFLAGIFPLPRNTRPATAVRLKNDKVYIGSLGIRDGNLVALVGGFKVQTQGKAPEIANSAKNLEQNGNLLGLYRFATEKDLVIVVNDQIREKGSNNAQSGAMLFGRNEVAYLRTEQNGKTTEPLIVE